MEINIEVVLLNIDRWLWIIIHHTIPLVNLQKYHKSDEEYWIHYMECGGFQMGEPSSATITTYLVFMSK